MRFDNRRRTSDRLKTTARELLAIISLRNNSTRRVGFHGVALQQPMQLHIVRASHSSSVAFEGIRASRRPDSRFFYECCERAIKSPDVILANVHRSRTLFEHCVGDSSFPKLFIFPCFPGRFDDHQPPLQGDLMNESPDGY